MSSNNNSRYLSFLLLSHVRALKKKKTKKKEKHKEKSLVVKLNTVYDTRIRGPLHPHFDYDSSVPMRPEWKGYEVSDERKERERERSYFFTQGQNRTSPAHRLEDHWPGFLLLYIHLISQQKLLR